jgi:hypothetical protein
VLVIVIDRELLSSIDLVFWAIALLTERDRPRQWCWFVTRKIIDKGFKTKDNPRLG